MARRVAADCGCRKNCARFRRSCEGAQREILESVERFRSRAIRAVFPLLLTALAFGVFVVVMLWFGFSVDYATTRDVYFTVAIAHVLAEAPFLLKML